MKNRTRAVDRLFFKVLRARLRGSRFEAKPRTDGAPWICSCGRRFTTLEAINRHVLHSGGLLHGDK